MHGTHLLGLFGLLEFLFFGFFHLLFSLGLWLLFRFGLFAGSSRGGLNAAARTQMIP